MYRQIKKDKMGNLHMGSQGKDQDKALGGGGRCDV